MYNVIVTNYKDGLYEGMKGKLLQENNGWFDVKLKNGNLIKVRKKNLLPIKYEKDCIDKKIFLFISVYYAYSLEYYDRDILKNVVDCSTDLINKVLKLFPEFLEDGTQFQMLILVCYVLALQTLTAHDYDNLKTGEHLKYFGVQKKDIADHLKLFNNIFKLVDYVPCSIHAKDEFNNSKYY